MTNFDKNIYKHVGVAYNSLYHLTFAKERSITKNYKISAACNNKHLLLIPSWS